MNRPTGRDLLTESTKPLTIVRFLARSIIGVIAAVAAARIVAGVIYERDATPLDQVATELAVGLCLVTLFLLVGVAFPLRRMWLQITDMVRDSEQELQERNRSQRFLRDVRLAFDMAADENELYQTAGNVLADSGIVRSEILVADSSRAHVQAVAVAEGLEAPGCGVTSPHRCPAVKRGSTLQFGDVTGIAACPRLRERTFPVGTVAACTPINVLGAPSAVLHSVYEPSAEPSTGEAVDLSQGLRQLEGIANRFGDRLGMIRAVAKTQLQANTDPLTGLLNRRAMENRVRELRGEGSSFALAMADLDHFKQLNDTFGHDTGDRALRLFARVATTVLRGEDVVCRHGGEEFVFVLPGARAAEAEPALHRIREELRDALATAHIPPFTVSMGLVDSTWHDDLAEILGAADRSLIRAKRSGRDRIVIDDARGESAIGADSKPVDEPVEPVIELR